MSTTVQALLAEAAAGGSRDAYSGDHDEARRDAEVLLGHCLGRPRSWLFTWPEAEVPAEPAARYRKLLARRRAGQPVAYLVGERDFWTLTLRVTGATLVPRPDTETLVSWALELPLPDDARVLDAGTGSGAIALALATERPRWRVTAVDRDPAALAVAAGNADRLGLGRVRFFESDWFAALAGERFDLVVANPPYLAADDPHLAGPALAHEPVQALVAGPTGLEDLAALVAAAPGQLVPGGWLLLEHGCDQGAAVRGLLAGAGFDAVATRRDLAGLERASGGRLPC
ncbi:MAG: peptide chain release factor N(5)-glutamine methyltransferase [Pseudohaliea sp.]